MIVREKAVKINELSPERTSFVENSPLNMNVKPIVRGIMTMPTSAEAL